LYFVKTKWIELSTLYNQQTYVQRFYSASSIYNQLHAAGKQQPVNCIDVSAGGNLGISGSNDGKVRIWDATSGTLKRDLVGHFGDIYVAKLLPSVQVAMTAGADLQIKIWRIEDALNAATLVGHKAAITSFNFIERGRNFVSCSKDGVMKLWDCASQTCITDLFKQPLSIKSNNYLWNCHVAQDATLVSAQQQQQQKLDKDFGTESKLAICCSESGQVTCVDVRNRSTIFKYQHESEANALNCCLLLNNATTTMAFAGSQGGELLQFDLRKIVVSSQDNSVASQVNLGSAAALKSMQLSHDKNRIWFTTSDGSAALYDYTTKQIVLDLTGPDYEPINGIAVAYDTAPSTQIFTACRDGSIRKYVL